MYAVKLTLDGIVMATMLNRKKEIKKKTYQFFGHLFAKYLSKKINSTDNVIQYRDAALKNHYYKVIYRCF